MGRDGQHIGGENIRDGHGIHSGLLQMKADGPTLDAKGTKRRFFDFAALCSE
jgi:hypothetical protein